MRKSHLINANINRAKEGARVLEDIARFILHDEIITRQYREIRHLIKISSPSYDVTEDLGRTQIEDNVRVNLLSIIQANAQRLQEALRVLEEMTTVSTDKQRMKELRFKTYDLHAKLYHSANKYLKYHLLQGLYLIIDTNVIPYPIEEIIDIINQSPVNIVQYRNKSASKKIIFNNAYHIKKRLDPNKLLIINDHIDVAMDIGDGVHLGQDDYPLERICYIVPDDFIVGISCHSLEEARMATQAGPSYIAIGCLFETTSKNNVIPTPLHELQKVCDEISLPVCAIGGIHMHNLEQILTTNIKMAALISYVWKTENPLQCIHKMHAKIIDSTTIDKYKIIL